VPLVFTTPAKWILCGEHSVIRGGRAIAFPLNNFSNSIFFEENESFSIKSDYSENVIFDLFKIGCEYSKISSEKKTGRLIIKSNIPIKSGLGSSSALCANIAKVFKYLGYCNDVFELAGYLENKFHKKSSGLDVTVALKNKPIIFSNNKLLECFNLRFWPPMLLTYSGEQCSTSNCVASVSDLFLKNEKLALELDQQMNLASHMCEEALKTANLHGLKEGIMLGNDTFLRWGLYTKSMAFHVEKLLSAGAIAAKPTGSGLGGYILSLWEDSSALAKLANNFPPAMTIALNNRPLSKPSNSEKIITCIDQK
jgi:mevalonate kinase